MATPSRRYGVDLIQCLKTEPYRFRFVQAMRLLALAARPEGEALGVPARLRLRTPATLAFPPSEITRLDSGTRAKETLELEVCCLGLTGPCGTLPQPYTETLMERRILHRDGTLHAFLDLFSHRACCLYYAAWRKYRIPAGFKQGPGDPFTERLGGLLTVKAPRGVPGALLAFFAGAFARRPLSSGSLLALLGFYFRVPVALVPFVGQWLLAPVQEQTRLGGPGPGLGGGAFLGQRLWDQQNKIRLRVGPLGAKAFRDFLPGNPGAESLGRLVKMHLGELLACDLELLLAPEGVLPLRLTSTAGASPRLGLDTWLHTRPCQEPSAPVAFCLQP